MSSNPEIGSDLPPRAAEVEPPATFVSVTAGGSATVLPDARAREVLIEKLREVAALEDRHMKRHAHAIRTFATEAADYLATPPASDAALPASVRISAGSAVEAEWIRQNAIGFMRHNSLCGIVGGYDTCTCGMEAARQPLLDAEIVRTAPVDNNMGVTANAILLLGNVISHLIGAADRLYEVELIHADAGTVLIRRRGTENIHRISIVQLEGIE